MNEETIFAAAMKKTSPKERAAYLDQACGRDAEIRNRLEALLAAHDQPDSFLDPPDLVAGDTVEHAPIGDGPGRSIGNYKLLQQIGEGGFGMVYMAEQQRPVRRKVALKIIKPGMDTRSVVARFEAERQALAMMDHENIARVLDGGATDGSRPYFVMELVKGVPITEYCDKNHLSTHDRLQLFVTVCQAVQHAHQKGIVHRDLKPSNIMVTLHDGQPVVKVIDFGVSKAINQRLTEKTLFTAFGQMVGTPQYMSPEQAEMSGLDVDTRSDIYSLGVLLYELLTGTTPLDAERLLTAGYAEIQRIICEAEPPKPSTRLSTSGERLTIIAKHRSASPERLHQVVRGDLDWIVMKALEKDRSRRYEAAGALAADVQRSLNEQPIEARPPSTAYRVRKFVRRNKGPVAAGVIVALALVVAVCGIGVGFVRARQEAEKARRLNRELTELLIEDALAASMSGNKQKADDAIQRATKAEASAAWIEMLHGQYALYAGDPDTAIEHLKTATTLEPNSLTPRAMLAIAYDLTGNPHLAAREMDRLDQLEPTTEIEHVFLGQARLYQDTSLGLTTLQRRVSSRSSPLARAILADALTHHAAETGKLSATEEAMEHVKAAESYMPDNAYVLMVGLWTHSVAIRLAEENTGANEDLRAEAARIADDLGQYPDYSLGRSVRSLYFRTIGEPEAEQTELQEAVASGAPGFNRNFAAALLYRLGDYESAAELLFRDNDMHNPWIALGRAEVSAFTNGGQREARAMYEVLTSAGPFRWKWGIAEMILLQQDDHQFRKRACEKRLVGTFLTPWERVALGYIGGKKTEDELLDYAAASSTERRHLSVAHKLIGMRLLLDGDRERAMRHLKICRELGFGMARHWSDAFLARLERDTGWPEWSAGTSAGGVTTWTYRE